MPICPTFYTLITGQTLQLHVVNVSIEVFKSPKNYEPIRKFKYVIGDMGYPVHEGKVPVTLAALATGFKEVMSGAELAEFLKNEGA